MISIRPSVVRDTTLETIDENVDARNAGDAGKDRREERLERKKKGSIRKRKNNFLSKK